MTKDFEEHFCENKPYGDIIIFDTFWCIRNIGTGIINNIKYCPWCGEKL